MATRFDPLCRPEPAPKHAESWKEIAPYSDGVYLVMQRGDVVAIYHPTYFRSINEVMADLIGTIRGGWQGPWGEAYIVWCNNRVMAVLHQPMDEEQLRVVTFNDPRNDPIGGQSVRPFPHWPTYAEWVASGRGDLWETGDDPIDRL